jgi:hypothetical protein
MDGWGGEGVLFVGFFFFFSFNNTAAVNELYFYSGYHA